MESGFNAQVGKEIPEMHPVAFGKMRWNEVRWLRPQLNTVVTYLGKVLNAFAEWKIPEQAVRGAYLQYCQLDQMEKRRFRSRDMYTVSPV